MNSNISVNPEKIEKIEKNRFFPIFSLSPGKWARGGIKITFMRDIMRDIMYSGSESPQNVANIIHWAYEVLEVATRREICENDDFRPKMTKNDPKMTKVVTFWRFKNNFYA